MFERYTDRSRRVIVLGHRALARAGLTADVIESIIAQARPPRVDGPRGHIPFTREAKRALELAVRESLQLGHNFIGTEHILLGVLADCEARPGSPPAEVLKACGTTPAEVRESVMTLLRGYGNVPAEEPDPAGEVTLTMVLARMDGIARDVGAIRKHLAAPE